MASRDGAYSWLPHPIRFLSLVRQYKLRSSSSCTKGIVRLNILGDFICFHMGKGNAAVSDPDAPREEEWGRNRNTWSSQLTLLLGFAARLSSSETVETVLSTYNSNPEKIWSLFSAESDFRAVSSKISRWDELQCVWIAEYAEWVQTARVQLELGRRNVRNTLIDVECFDTSRPVMAVRYDI